MRVAAAVCLVVGVLLVLPASAQKKSTTPPPVEFTGCVSEQPGSSGGYTLTDAQNNGKYRLTGKKMDKYAGKLVSVVIGPAKRLSVSGGLWPSPNVAGQAGALDPAQESISRQRGGTGQGAGDLSLPELHVVRVKTVGAACR